MMKRKNQHNKKTLQTTTLYCIILAAISSWWYLGLSPSIGQTSLIPNLPPASFSLKPSLSEVFPYLSPMDREVIHQALGGDAKLMKKLMAEWDVDAQILETEGIFCAKRLSRKHYIRGQLLGRQLTATEQPASEQRYLPQTYQAASYLLALTSPDQLIGIPKGLRNLVELYPRERTSQIPANIDAYHAEALFKADPSLAIVSNVYTDPVMIQMFRCQNIPILAQRQTETFTDIQTSILEIGQAVNQQPRAELLTIFIEAAMLAIDNRLLAMNRLIADSEQTLTTLYLNRRMHYSTPTPASLTGQLLSRVDTVFPMASHRLPCSALSCYSIPVSDEDLIMLNPENLIIATNTPKKVWENMINTPACREVSAIRNGKVFFVSETVQEVSDQYLVLAYYDIACGIINAHRQS